MSITTITINTVNYTAYASLAEVNAYLAVDPTRNTAWNALTDEQKNINIVASTRRLDLLDFSGEKTGGATQERQWPRTGATCNGVDIGTTTDVPIEIQNATALLAGSITLDSTVSNAGTSGSNIESVRAGSAQVQFFSPETGVAVQDQTVFDMVSCLLAGNAAAIGTAGFGLASGTTGDNAASSFEDRDAPAPSEGYP